MDNKRKNTLNSKKYYKNSVAAFSLTELIATLIFLGVVAILALTGSIGRHDNYQDQNQYDENVATEEEYTNETGEESSTTTNTAEPQKVSVKIEEEYVYDSFECTLLDSETCTSLAGNSKMEKGTYSITNIGGNKTWSEAKSECEKSAGAKVADIAQLKKLYIDGVLACQDDSRDCDFWAADESNNGDDGVYINAYSGTTDHMDKESSSSSIQVLCISKQQ